VSARAALRRLVDRAREYPLERRYQGDFGGAEDLSEFGYGAEGRERYGPSRFLSTRRTLRRLRLTPDDVIADLGAGKGLAVLMAAEHPVRRVIGVELVPELADLARRNVDLNRARARAPVEVVQSDALEWPIPEDLSVVYMYSPFFGEIFGGVLERLLESVERHPRPLRMVYSNPREHNRLLASGAQVLDVTSTDWPARGEWWLEPIRVTVTYGIGAGPFPRPRGRKPRSAAFTRWSVASPQPS
jgi:SAM-dependent methyltransferase